jgi:hypothetical protein
MKKLIYLLAIAIMIGACNQTGADQNNASEVPSESASAEINPIPNDLGVYLVSNCTSADATFYTIGGSISTESCSIFFTYIDQSQPEKLIKEEFGHIVFLKGGEVLSMAKIHLTENGGYIKFEIDKNFYYHNLNSQGVAFFKSMENYQGN